jgi:hypothetical protein
MKKVYVAARAKFRKDDVAQIQEKIMKMGYQPAYDWPAYDSAIKKPYRHIENRKNNLKAQAEMLEAAKGADLFILLDDPGLRGAYVELGAFLTDCLDNSKGRKAYIVGPDSHKREFIFESPDYVIFADTIKEVYKDLDRNAAYERS